MWRQLKPAAIATLLFTALTGLVYPLAVTGIAKLLFPDCAEGSLIERDGKLVGSALIGQPFAGPRYFWSRPSPTSPSYNGGASAGSNLGPTNAALFDRIAGTVAALRTAHGDGPVPVDLATTSASGLDPHITPAAARYQIARVARERGLPEAEVAGLVAEHTESRQLGILGEPRVNVLRLNLALDRVAPLATGRR